MFTFPNVGSFRAVSGWTSGGISSWKRWSGAAQGGGGRIPEGTQGMAGDGGEVGIGPRLDSVMLEVISDLNNSRILDLEGKEQNKKEGS